MGKETDCAAFLFRGCRAREVLDVVQLFHTHRDIRHMCTAVKVPEADQPYAEGLTIGFTKRLRRKSPCRRILLIPWSRKVQTTRYCCNSSRAGPLLRYECVRPGYVTTDEGTAQQLCVNASLRMIFVNFGARPHNSYVFPPPFAFLDHAPITASATYVIRDPGSRMSFLVHLKALTQLAQLGFKIRTRTVSPPATAVQ